MMRHELSADRLRLSVGQPLGRSGLHVKTYVWAEPATPGEVTEALRAAADPAKRLARQPGQRFTASRWPTRFGTLHLCVMTGPPTWWRPVASRRRDGLLAGWLRAGVIVHFARGETR